MTTNVEIVSKYFGALREFGARIGVSHTSIMHWRDKDGNFPPRYNGQIRDAALRLSRERVSAKEWDDKDVNRFLSVVENCLQDDICPSCGKRL